MRFLFYSLSARLCCRIVRLLLIIAEPIQLAGETYQALAENEVAKNAGHKNG